MEDPEPLRKVKVAIEHYKAAIRDDLVRDGGTVDPLDVVQAIRMQAVEFRVMRELVFDLLCSFADGSIDTDDRRHVVDEFFHRLERGYLESAAHLSRSRIQVATGVNGFRA